MLRTPAQLLRGFCMGAADVVPGVSGGTIALIFGIYEDLVHQIRQGAAAAMRLLRLDVTGFLAGARRLNWAFLLPLGAGILLAILTLARTIEHLLETRPEETAAGFFGLVAASIVVAWGMVRTRDNLRLVVLIASAVATFFALGLRAGDIEDPEWWMWLAAGAVAVCAMILPGISGSFILLMIGMYDTVLGAVNDRDLDMVVVFVVGAVLGLAVFSTLLDRLLRRHHDTVLAALVGLMAGSLRVLWPWPEGTDSARIEAPPSDEWFGALVIAVVAGVAVLGLVGLGANKPERH